MSNQIQLRERASYSYSASSWRQQTNPFEKKSFENVIKQLVHTSAARSAIYEARGKFGIFRVLQTSRVLHISMNERWHMNQLLIRKPCLRETETEYFTNGLHVWYGFWFWWLASLHRQGEVISLKPNLEYKANYWVKGQVRVKTTATKG